MGGEEKTTIELTRDTWRRLNAEKEGPGDTFENVIKRLLDPGVPGDDLEAAPAPEPSERRAAPETAESDGGEKIRCEHCGHTWVTRSSAERPSCSSCGYKTDRLPP